MKQETGPETIERILSAYEIGRKLRQLRMRKKIALVELGRQQQAAEMLGHLNAILKSTLKRTTPEKIPLSKELEVVENYLAIEQVRFADRLRIEIKVEPAALDSLVPCFLLQPIVENAIRHGISRRAAGGTVTVQAAPVNGRLEIRVLDDGVGLPAAWSMENANGLGLSITRERIAGLHPNGDSRFVVRNREEGGTEVEISLPLKLDGEADNGRALA